MDIFQNVAQVRGEERFLLDGFDQKTTSQSRQLSLSVITFYLFIITIIIVIIIIFGKGVFGSFLH